MSDLKGLEEINPNTPCEYCGHPYADHDWRVHRGRILRVMERSMLIRLTTTNETRGIV